MSEFIKFRCTSVTQPIGTFYIGAVEARDLVKISYADIRRLEDRDVEKYLGIQRPLSESRVKELSQYVKNVDATFPTSVIIAVSSEDALFDETTSVMSIRNEPSVAKIIDGQHRIAGLEGYQNGLFQVNVTVFVDMDIEDQAMVFATINLKQTKVSKSLAYDLYEFAESRSPQKTCHNIAKLLNVTPESPFTNKIKILGVATGKPEESITQATFVDRLIKYISRDPMKDRDTIKRGKTLTQITSSESKRLIFRNMFIQGKDAEIAKVLWDYFGAVEARWPEAWRSTPQGNILSRTTGFGALVRFLRPAYLHFTEPGNLVPPGSFVQLFSAVPLNQGDFTTENYVPGSSGEARLYQDLLRFTGLSDQV
jgi:DGQHR domain-containing protein